MNNLKSFESDTGKAYTAHCPPVASSSAPRRRSFFSVLSGNTRDISAERQDAPPPAYHSIQSSQQRKHSPRWLRKPGTKYSESFEDELEVLRKYDIVLLVDDSGSMVLPGSKKGRTRWEEAGEALATLAEITQQYDTDGIDIYFLNNRREALNIKSSIEVQQLFSSVKPTGSTPIGERLDQLIKPRLCELEDAVISRDGTPRDRTTREEIKRVNFIVITDGAASDEPRQTIIDAAIRLQAIRNLCLVQLGIQFVQIGNDPTATRALKELDDDLHRAANIRDIVDTTPSAKLKPVSAEGLIKILLGGINRRIDRL
ncbi:hypothetical protein MIND_00792400 [Mycena indigotica]|uniref:VWFA domain-containing protein n=1 Tax=Mycena indigotica TaxID=2126181 RepID=A0A8H6SMW7_9AGAR|nr:uncharacterized protein MIND_00792400 [Mycena indigotica]KAF7302254.1 hypothetical protein MIND_00792400 [Mycena indigotica]